jgi:RimJ/RimL family protein N-acetyltransferase
MHTPPKTLEVAPVTLTGREVRLVPLTAGHLPRLHRHFAPFEHQLTWPGDDSLEAFQAFMAPALSPSPARVAFAVELRATGEPVGSTSFLDARARDLAVEVGSTWYGRAHQGTRVNPECKYLLLAHAFGALGARRVQLKTSSENLHSQRAIARLGATREGTLRNFQVRQDGRSRDTVMFSITDDDWPRVAGGLEARLGYRPGAT